MKIYTPENKYNIIPKAFSIFPLFFALATLSVGINKNSFILLLFSFIFSALFIYTFFFTKYEKYLDTNTKKIIKKIKWLWINSKEEEAINNYQSICICIGDSIHNSNLTALTTSTRLDVVLVRNHASTSTFAGFGAIENFLLKNLIKTPNEAKEYADKISELIGLNVTVEEQLTKLLKYDLLQHHKEF